MHDSLSPKLREHLDGLEEWFAQQDNYRHALAHRIPLYVPPYLITESKKAAYQKLEVRKSDAINRGARDDHDRLSAEQDALGVFSPVMTHSFGENTNHIVFHAQILADFNTVEELGRIMLEELDIYYT